MLPYLAICQHKFSAAIAQEALIVGNLLTMMEERGSPRLVKVVNTGEVGQQQEQFRGKD